jgi:hypothetical protein
MLRNSTSRKAGRRRGAQILRRGRRGPRCPLRRRDLAVLHRPGSWTMRPPTGAPTLEQIAEAIAADPVAASTGGISPLAAPRPGAPRQRGAHRYNPARHWSSPRTRSADPGPAPRPCAASPMLTWPTPPLGCRAAPPQTDPQGPHDPWPTTPTTTLWSRADTARAGRRLGHLADPGR